MDSNHNDPSNVAFGLFEVNLHHAGRHILKDVTLALRVGEFHALVGNRNGGKTAIASVLAGTLEITSGTVRFTGKDYGQTAVRHSRKNGVCYIGGSPKVFPKLTVAENLLSGETVWRRAFRSWRGYLQDLRHRLDDEGIDLPLSCSLDSLPPEDWFYVEILGRLFRSPRVLILDEALEGLSPARKLSLMPLLRKRTASGMIVLWITHKIDEAVLMADRLSVVRNGKILLSSRPEGLEHVNLIHLCYAQLEERDEIDVSMHQFQQLMRFTGALIRDLPQAVAILDTEGIVRFLNRSAVSLFVGGDANSLAVPLKELLGEENRAISEKIISAVQTDSEGEWHTVAVRHTTGTMLSDIRLRRIAEHSRPVGYMVQMEDVSEREEMRRRMMLSDNLASVGLLAAGVAHEVNNPLEIIGNYLVFLKSHDFDPESARVLRKMEDEAARIQQIVNNLVVFSGNAGNREAIVDLHALCLELCALLRFHNKDRRIVFDCPPVDFPALVRIDPTEMRQVFLNLFRNSIAVLRDGGRISVEFSQPSRHERQTAMLEMRFSDNGPGIALENPSEVFLPFVTTRAEGGKNHGLGLFIVYGIIEKYGGGITAENRRDGGCVFKITLPMAADVV